MKRIYQIILVLFTVIFITGSCGNEGVIDQDKPNQNDNNIENNPDISGIISEIELINSNMVEGRILVELDEPNNTSDKFWVTIENDIPVYEFIGTGNDLVSFSSLRDGQNVEVWFNGAVMESYPAQVNAKQVLIVP